ncbi:FAD dependent oxidoreductase domain-containing protein [Ditylenchus destructor]|uniref:FAD-dependent oxidoreductase domain-containing protein 1 n=1 Tax=Ditylenchus destructor TaxID=166010 RepID=A0AAD4MY86_9BILA|nr:FAD dependent oxidoreductase domain-containing protein [Ditylenchus destructor]
MLRRTIVGFVVQQSRPISFTSTKQWQTYENDRNYDIGEDVWQRAKAALQMGFTRSARRYNDAKYDAFRKRNPIAHMKKEIIDLELLPFRSDFVIIGGGLTGSATAFWLKERFRDEDLTVTVIESTDHFSRSRSMLGTGIISQQFSIPEFVEMSAFSAEFIRHAGEHLKILDSDPPDIDLLPVNFLHLAKDEKDAADLKEAWRMMVEKGVRVAYMKADELQTRFPFMNFDDVVAGTLGLENEGVFDNLQLLSALREKNLTLGVRYVKAEVEGMDFRRPPDISCKVPEEHDHKIITDIQDRGTNRNIRLLAILARPQMIGASARPIRFYRLVNAAGPWAGEIAKMAGIGQGEGILSVPLPIVCKRRTNFVLHAPDVPTLEMPGQGEGILSVPLPIVCKRRTNFVLHAPDVPTLEMPGLHDTTGIFCHPEGIGFNYICGRHPTKRDIVTKDKATDDVDYEMFYKEIWPLLVKRVPSFKTAKVINAWNLYEDCNTFDDVPILGEHLLFKSFYQMCGFGGYGSQLAIAAGRLYQEKEYEMAYLGTNVRKFDMRRIMQGKRYHEPLRAV